VKALLLALAVIGMPLAAQAAAGTARDVVSLNLCTDEALLTLAPERAAAVSFLARDPSLSVVAGAASLVPAVRADAEAILARRPSLVLGGRFGAQAVLAALRATGVRVAVFDEPRDFAGVREEWRAIAGVLGVKTRGEAAIAAMDAALGKAPAPRGTAVWLEPRLVAAGADTIEGAVLRHAGYVPVTRVGGLEALAARPPGLLVVPGLPRFPSLADAVLGHPVLAGIARATVPARLVACAGPWSVEAVRLLR
jgi:iron complex transport system substrate-binding protein